MREAPYWGWNLSRPRLFAPEVATETPGLLLGNKVLGEQPSSLQNHDLITHQRPIELGCQEPCEQAMLEEPFLLSASKQDFYGSNNSEALGQTNIKGCA